MTVYASTPGFVDHRPHPRTLMLIVAGHAALIAVVMAAKMDLPQRIVNAPIIVDLIPDPTPPDPEPQVARQPAAQPIPSRPTPQVQIPNPTNDRMDTTQTVPLDPIPLGPAVDPAGSGPIVADPVRTGPRFATPASEMRPPYPEAKRRLEEEAVLKLRLSIDQRGRVVAVEPVGNTDRAFLDSARRHIIAHWRYKPATEDGRAVASSTLITLRFELDG
jgi:periplasmic protein TonB